MEAWNKTGFSVCGIDQQVRGLRRSLSALTAPGMHQLWLLRPALVPLMCAGCLHGGQPAHSLLQGLGFSEGVRGLRCFVLDFDDYIDDAVQFRR